MAAHLSMDSSVDEFMNQYPDAVDVEGIGAFKRKMICLIEKDGVLSVVESDTKYKHFSIYVDYNDTFVRFVVMQMDGVEPNEEEAKDLKPEEASAVSSQKSETISASTVNSSMKTENRESVSGFMEKAIAAMENGDKESALQYAERACEDQGIEAKILSDDELSKLEQRQEEIEQLIENISSESEEGLESKIELSRERLDNVVLIFYNQIAGL